MANESKTTHVSEIDKEIPILPMISGRISLSLPSVKQSSPHCLFYQPTPFTLHCCQQHRRHYNSAMQRSRTICEHNLATHLTEAVESFSYKRWIGETFANLHKESQHFDLYLGFQIHWFYCEFFKMQKSQYIFLWPLLALCQKVNIIRYVYASILIYVTEYSIRVVTM